MKLVMKSAVAATMLVAAQASYAACGSVSMADWNWDSGTLLANVDKIILEEGYGCDVEMIPGGTTQIFAALDAKGTPEIAGELWVNALQEPLKVGLAEGRMHVVNGAPITDLGEGWFVTPAFAKKYPELNTVEKIIERPDLFPSAEDSSRGALVGCFAGWGCLHSNGNLYRAFDMEAKGWDLIDPGSQAGLDGLWAKAVARDEAMLGYYWSPTSLVGNLGLVPIPWETPFAGDENWDSCISKPIDECANPQKTSYIESEVNTVISDSFMKRSSIATEFLKARVYPGSVMGEMLSYMSDEQADGKSAAYYFLETYADVWQSWVPADVAAKVKASL